MKEIEIKVEVSARHIHLSKEDKEKLFGKGYKLQPLRWLSQPKLFAAKETVALKIGDKVIENVRIVGPEREKTQVEISLTDAFFFKIFPPIKVSGDISGTPGAVLIAPNGNQVEIKEGVIVPQRHIHASPKEAKELGLSQGDIVSVKIEGKRGLIFDNVVVRVKEGFSLAMHIDTDEGNAAGIPKGGKGKIILP